ncbi:MAG TPA: hypothetical protein VFA37_03745 [Gaiellaceae bacterium]|nr:hypothetical protein [Gaiellaceae bacterium]
MDEEIVERLDQVIALLKIAHADAIETARKRIRADKVYAAILDTAGKWSSAAKVHTAAKRKGSARSTTSRKIAELIELGLLEKQGGGKTLEYRATGLI